MHYSLEHRPDEQGQRWLAAKVQALLAGGPGRLVAQDAPSLWWGTADPTGRTLALQLEGEPAPRSMVFPGRSIADCGTHGTHNERQRATRYIGAQLRAMGLL